jgi:exopolysaccharide biosynthesis protein
MLVHHGNAFEPQFLIRNCLNITSDITNSITSDMNSTRGLTKTGKRQQNKEIILMIDDEFGIVDQLKSG